MDARCENCKYFAKMYVPPIKEFDNIAKNDYVCVGYGLDESQVMYLGERDYAKNMRCEMFTEK